MRRYFLILLLLVACLAGCQRTQRHAPEYQGKSLRYWEAKAASGNAPDRIAAAEALGEIGPPGLPGLVKLLTDKDHLVRGAAMLGVAKMGPTAVPGLRKLAHDAKPAVRNAAAKAIAGAMLNLSRKEAVPQLIEMLRDSSPDVRAIAAKTVMIMTPEAKSAIPALTKVATEDNNTGVRKAAYTALVIITKNPKPLAYLNAE